MEDSPRRIEAFCSAHQAPAGWSCRACGQSLCPDCATDAAGAAGCGLCGAVCTTILSHRFFPPLRAALADVFAYPVRAGQWIGLVLAALFLAVVRVYPILGDGLAELWLWMYLFVALDRSAEGKPDRPPLASVPPFWLFATCAWRAVCAIALASWPAALYLRERGKTAWPVELFRLDRLAIDPTVLVLLIIPAVWVPIALLFASADQPLVDVVNPWRAWDALRRLGRVRFVPLLALAAALAVAFCADALFDWRFHGYPFNTPLSEGLKLYAFLAAARALGWIIYVRGDRLGIGRLESYFVRALGTAVPRGAKLETQVDERDEYGIPVSLRRDANAPPSPPEADAWRPPAPPGNVLGEDLVTQEEFERGLAAEDVVRLERLRGDRQ